MPAQNNYDSAQIRVDPWVLESSGKAILTAVQLIDLTLTHIFTELDALRISWVGDDPNSSPALAAEFSERWSTAVTILYGTEAEPGVLGVLAEGGIDNAAHNYSKAESEITQAFKSLYDNLHSPDKSNRAFTASAPTDALLSSLLPPEDHVDAPDPPFHSTSVNETF
ncbi:hypothetical protein NKH18_15050 [Streptomyces sp. M10(2022)]